MEDKYVFGVIETGQPGAGEAKLPLPEPVYTVPYRDISAVVMDTAMVDLASMPKEAAARYLLRHQQVLEKLTLPVIPMKLGTYVSTYAEITDVLLFGYRDFKETFGEIEGKVEIDIAARWSDPDSIIKETGEESEEVQEFKKKLMSKTGGITIEDQMKAGCTVKKALEGRNKKTASEIAGAFSEIALAQRTHVLMDDSMILNAALLVRNNDRKRFDAILDKLDGLYQGRINFRCIGPLPTYSFYTAEIKKVGSGELDKAKKLLGLWDYPVCKNEIEKAYRQRARMCHPDVVGHTRRKGQICLSPEIESTEEFNEINRAYRLLIECSASGACHREDGSVLIIEIMRIRE